METDSLGVWQQEFVDRFVAAKASRSLLVAPAGSGKTTASLSIAKLLLQRAAVDGILVISDLSVIREQWKRVGSDLTLPFSEDLPVELKEKGVALSYDAFERSAASESFESNYGRRRWLILADEIGFEESQISKTVDSLLTRSPGSRVLYISRTAPVNLDVDEQYSFPSQIYLGREVLDALEISSTIRRYAPSIT